MGPGTSLGSKVMDFEETPGNELKLPFEVKLTFITSVLLFYPVMICMLLHSKWVVQFFIGHWALYTAVVVPIWVLMCHFAIVNRVLSIRVAPIFMIVIPTAFLACACQIQAWQFNSQETILLSKDCDSFLLKARLDRAWQKANSILNQCTADLVRVTGATRKETQLIARLEECKGYEEAVGEFGSDWNFLEYMERSDHCGGWCTVQLPIWKQSTVPSDSCSLAVARQLVGNISLMGFQVTVYCGILLFCACVALLMNPG
eukprot:CAMPEP_0171096398 /NCGR_PEP_ID=MMETSP0766_2-20121228/44569_1 /TAXON_ID=439317 /ORGANISM="Gambierdiscus australes, Strain CAWD 149" /LENGTH=258 /DNA_ID=CAMNT_0011555369 /DNA_START=64 /DNA_END=837 /DNA_ORIENTATION=+